jgi:hypothetical protein
VQLQSTDTGRTSSPDGGDTLLVARERRFADAIRFRRAAIRVEMQACLRGQEEAYNLAEALLDLAEALLDEFDQLADSDRTLRSALMQLELRLQRSGKYFLSDEQIDIVLALIAEVGADTRRFCNFLGVEAIAKVPAHRFEDAMASKGDPMRRDDYLDAASASFGSIIDASDRFSSWRSKLIVNNNGRPRACLANTLTALRHAPDLNGSVRYNDFAYRIEVAQPLPWDPKSTRGQRAPPCLPRRHAAPAAVNRPAIRPPLPRAARPDVRPSSHVP